VEAGNIFYQYPPPVREFLLLNTCPAVVCSKLQWPLLYLYCAYCIVNVTLSPLPSLHASLRR
jgi:hypothetical protein